MSRDNVGDIPEVEADEDVDPDVLICEEEEGRARRKSARQILEEMKDEQE